MNILVLKGGKSSEREISLKSAACVVDALKSIGHKVVEHDTALSVPTLKELAANADLVLPILHGEEGEDGRIQQALEALSIPYLGSNPQTSKLCFDKIAFKEVVSQLGLLTPEYDSVTQESFKGHPLIANPFVLKPNKAGSSVDTFIITSPARKVIPNEVFARNKTMLLEELVEGTEITVGVVGEVALPVVEIIPPKGEFFDYENKYNGKTQELCPPHSIDALLQSKVQSIALNLHKAVHARHLSRTDMIVRGEDIYVLEINTIPGLTNQSLLPKAAAARGQSFEQLVEEFVSLVLESA